MKFYTNDEGKLVPNTYPYVRCNPALLANTLTRADIARILAACDGDTSRLVETLRQAVAIKAGIMVQRQEEIAKCRKEEYKRRSAAFHNQIMDEIRELSGGAPFTATSLQLAAAKNPAFPVRSWQMYNRHMMRALNEGESVKRENKEGQVIVYIIKNGKERQRRVGYNAPTIWSFTN